ncbi:MAG: NAD+ synthase [Candidatus Aminicenantes bacterium]|nr:NAD+ synthase [Candidatus Aminicenantes bacterium]
MKIDCAFVERVLCAFVREELGKAGFRRGVVGLSGGLDSSVSAALAAEALGPKNVLGLILPYGRSYAADTEDARDLARRLKIRFRVLDIAPMVDAYFRAVPSKIRTLKGNKMARERMSVLYDFSAREKALIIGTSNKTELLIGYGTVHGDMACALNPLGDLYKTQVRQLAAHLRLPERILKKKPTAGLWPGQTDEDEIGLSYDELDRILYRLVDLRLSKAEVVSSGFARAKVERILVMIKKSQFKRCMPPIAKISSRTIGHDFLYPYDWGR